MKRSLPGLTAQILGATTASAARKLASSMMKGGSSMMKAKPGKAVRKYKRPAKKGLARIAGAAMSEADKKRYGKTRR